MQTFVNQLNEDFHLHTVKSRIHHHQHKQRLKKIGGHLKSCTNAEKRAIAASRVKHRIGSIQSLTI